MRRTKGGTCVQRLNWKGLCSASIMWCRESGDPVQHDCAFLWAPQGQNLCTWPFNLDLVWENPNLLLCVSWSVTSGLRCHSSSAPAAARAVGWRGCVFFHAMVIKKPCTSFLRHEDMLVVHFWFFFRINQFRDSCESRTEWPCHTLAWNITAVPCSWISTHSFTTIDSFNSLPPREVSTRAFQMTVWRD